jgi:hypothetical protein
VNGSGDGARMVAASGQLGSVARHQTPQSDIPASQGLHRLESFQESLTGRRSLKTPSGSKSIAGRDMAALDRFGGLACQPMETGPNVQRAWQVLPSCRDIGLMVIGDDGHRPGLGGRSARRKNAWADARSRCSRSSTSTTWPCSSTAR